MKMKLTRTLVILTSVLILSVGLTAYAATTLFTQSFPGETFTTSVASLKAGGSCCGGTLYLDPNTSIVPIIAGLPATLIYARGKVGHAAFSSLSSGGGKLLSVTPVFIAPSGWTLGVGIAQSSGECTLGS
jgi:hypothetical protein